MNSPYEEWLIRQNRRTGKRVRRHHLYLTLLSWALILFFVAFTIWMLTGV